MLNNARHARVVTKGNIPATCEFGVGRVVGCKQSFALGIGNSAYVLG